MKKKRKRARNAGYRMVDDVVITARDGAVRVDVIIGTETLRLSGGFALAVRVVRQAAKVLDRENVVTFIREQAAG